MRETGAKIIGPLEDNLSIFHVDSLLLLSIVTEENCTDSAFVCESLLKSMDSIQKKGKIH